MSDALSSEQMVAVEMDGKAWPIARITVNEDDSVTATLYAPGLPPGSYDVFLGDDCAICGEHENKHAAIAGHQFLRPGECCGAADGEHCARQYGICVDADLPRCRHNLNQQTCDTSALGDALPKEMQRIRDVLIPAYQPIGPAGAFGLMMLRQALDRAAQAMISGDVVKMLRAYQELKESQ